MMCAICKKPISRPYVVDSENNKIYCSRCIAKLRLLAFPYDIEKRPQYIQALTPEQHTETHIHDITLEYIKNYKAEIEREIKAKIYVEINKIIQLLEFTVAINAESVTIQGDNIPLLLNGLKKMREENEALKHIIKPFNLKKK